MAYFIDLFSSETYEAFTRSDRATSGFRLRHKRMADRINRGDVFVCYLTRLSRWFGLLEVIEGPFIDDKPLLIAEARMNTPRPSDQCASAPENAMCDAPALYRSLPDRNLRRRNLCFSLLETLDGIFDFLFAGADSVLALIRLSSSVVDPASTQGLVADA